MRSAILFLCVLYNNCSNTYIRQLTVRDTGGALRMHTKKGRVLVVGVLTSGRWKPLLRFLALSGKLALAQYSAMQGITAPTSPLRYST